MENFIYIETVQIDLLTNKTILPIFKDGNYIGDGDDSRFEVLEAFEAEPFHYASILEGGHELHAFNTCNHGAPVIACGVYDENFDFAVVNFHRGGDVRGNYSQAYYIEGYDNVIALISQNTELTIILSNGKEYRQTCENSEAYFPFDTLNIDDSDLLEEPLTTAQLEEIEAKMSGLFCLSSD